MKAVKEYHYMIKSLTQTFKTKLTLFKFYKITSKKNTILRAYFNPFLKFLFLVKF